MYKKKSQVYLKNDYEILINFKPLQQNVLATK